MRRHALRIASVALGIVALIFLALMLKDTPELFEKPGYDAKAPTEAKFARMARWIPEGSEFYAVADVPRALEQPGLRNRLIEMVGAHAGVAADLVGALLQNEGAIGLLAVSGSLGDGEGPPRLVVIAQGDFDEEIILPAIRAAMSEGRAGLTARNTEWATIYYESDASRPFGFMILDGSHMAVGEREALEHFFLTKPDPPKAMTIASDDVIFGHISIGPRIQSVAPRMLVLPHSVDFSSADGIYITATMACPDALKAMSLRMFLEGVRSLVILQNEHNVPLVRMLRGFSITSGGTDVHMTTEIAPLLELWDEDLGYEWDDLARPDVHKPPVGEL